MTAEKQRLIEDRDKVKNWRQWALHISNNNIPSAKIDSIYELD